MKQLIWLINRSLTFIVAMAACGQTYDFSQLDQLLARAAADIPTGLEVLVVQNGQEIYWKQFGPWPKNNQAKIASATKWFSGAVIMSLVDDGMLSLEDRASKYLPYMTGDKAAITVRQLMSHTSGFAGEFPLVDRCLSDPSDTLDHCAQALANTPLKVPPGTGFIYSGAGMQIAGRVAEVASGKDWQTLFRERITGPLDMRATDYEYEGPTQNPRISGGGRSNVSEYMKYLTMLYQRGVYQGRRILSTRAIDAMLSDQTRGVPILESPLPGGRYGIGNWLDDPDNPGGASQNSSIGLAGWTPLLDRSRNLQVIVGMQNALKPFQPYYPQLKSVLRSIIPPAALTPWGVTNGASYEAGPLAPGEIVALFGSNLGPLQPISAQAVNGSVPASLAGTEVAFDGVPAPLLYTSAQQITAVTPFEIAGKTSVQVQVSYNGTKTPAVSLPVSETWPALFAVQATGRGPGAILNQDGSLNSASNPAQPGTVLQLFGTGAGTFARSVSVTIGGLPATILYAGPAPGLVAGVFQVNTAVPSGIAVSNSVPVIIQAGRNTSLSIITVAVQ